MKLVPFVAASAEAALAQIHEQLGPDAVVISVRRVPVQGLSRFWQQHGHIEVVAGVPDENARPRNHFVPPGDDAYVPFHERVEPETPAPPEPRRWRSITWLESMGLWSALADRLEEKVRSLHGENPLPMPIGEWSAVRSVLAGYWRPARKSMEGTNRPHVFIGPPGSGKTTALCKWMTTAVLAENRKVQAWRLDGDTANTAEFLSLHGEMIGVPVERFWRGSEDQADLYFVDFPGVEMHNATAMTALRSQLAALPQPHLHLVLNAACETTILFEQFQAFAPLAPEDIIFTHLDEELRRVKLWNFVLGTNCSLSFLAAGQKIPGDFQRAESALLFPGEKSP